MRSRTRSRSLTVAMSALMISAFLIGTAAAPVTAAKSYQNCTALNKVYPHGVGKWGAVDHVSGSTKKVTNFKHSNALYAANSGKDRDHDKIACEKL